MSFSVFVCYYNYNHNLFGFRWSSFRQRCFCGFSLWIVCIRQLSFRFTKLERRFHSNNSNNTTKQQQNQTNKKFSTITGRLLSVRKQFSAFSVYFAVDFNIMHHNELCLHCVFLPESLEKIPMKRVRHKQGCRSHDVHGIDAERKKKERKKKYKTPLRICLLAGGLCS